MADASEADGAEGGNMADASEADGAEADGAAAKAPAVAPDEPEAKGNACDDAADAAAELLEAEKKRAEDGGTFGDVLPDGWAEMTIQQRIMQHHPIVLVRNARVHL